MEIVIAVLCGFILDLIFGDPRWMPHPIRLIGLFIHWTEVLLRKVFPKSKTGKRLGGMFLCLIVIAISFAVPFFILKGLELIHPWLKLGVETLFCYQIFATKSLKKESMRVYDHIKQGDLPLARKFLSWIVGRDTENLSFTQITKAVVETVAENASDGVIAPMIFMMIGGAPLGFFYKGINTLDSMVGYKNDQYMEWGKFSAIVDDIVNFIPARITAFAMMISAFVLGFDGKNSWKIYWRDRHNHASPNSAHPEAACAGALGIELAGSAYYFGKLYEKKTIGDAIKPVDPEDIPRTTKLMYAASVLCLILFETIRIIWVIVL